MQKRILQIKLLLFVEYCRMYIRVYKEEATHFVFAHSHHYEELSMINSIELGQEYVTTAN